MKGFRYRRVGDWARAFLKPFKAAKANRDEKYLERCTGNPNHCEHRGQVDLHACVFRASLGNRLGNGSVRLPGQMAFCWGLLSFSQGLADNLGKGDLLGGPRIQSHQRWRLARSHQPEQGDDEYCHGKGLVDLRLKNRSVGTKQAGSYQPDYQ